MCFVTNHLLVAGSEMNLPPRQTLHPRGLAADGWQVASSLEELYLSMRARVRLNSNLPPTTLLMKILV